MKFMYLLALGYPERFARNSTIASLPPEGEGGEGEGGKGGGDGGGGGGGGGEPKTFTQEQLNGFLAAERKKLTDKQTAQAAEIEALKAKVAENDELKAKLAKIEEDKELAGKSELEKERARAEKEANKLRGERDTAIRERDEARGATDNEKASHRMTRARNRLTSALTQAEVFPTAADDALEGMVRSAEFDFDDETGELKSLTLNHDGTRYQANELKKAAESFLKHKPHFAKGAGGGTGATRPTGGGAHGGKPLHELSTDQLLEIDRQKQGK
jgi:hypothetical protein